MPLRRPVNERLRRSSRFREQITALTTGLTSAGTSVRAGAEAARDSYRDLISLQEQWFAGAASGCKE